jgi:parvulin-like peptidyl-prolyl isomerase
MSINILPVDNRNITAEEIIPLLVNYQIIPYLLGESIIDRAIASIDCTPEELAYACHKFEQHLGLTSEAQKQAWQTRYGLNQEQFTNLATRRLKVEKFKQAKWERELESYFLQRKSQLDRVIYSLIRVKESSIAYELYFRLQEGEQTFAELASQYAEGSEALTSGMMGPVELGTLHPILSKLLYHSQPGVVQSPVIIEEWTLILRLEKLLSAKLDQPMRQRLLQEKFRAWFQEQLDRLDLQDKKWMDLENFQIQTDEIFN